MEEIYAYRLIEDEITINESLLKFPELNEYIVGVIRDEKFVIMKKNDKLQHNDESSVNIPSIISNIA